MLHQHIAANDTADTPLDVLAADLIARLNRVPEMTDMPTCVSESRKLIARVRFLATLPDIGRAMLGRNGEGPRIAACLASAERHGFDWRSPEALTAIVHQTAGGL